MKSFPDNLKFRYIQYHNPDHLLESLSSKNQSLRGIAQLVGVSHETVRKDCNEIFGKDWRKILNNIKNKRQNNLFFNRKYYDPNELKSNFRKFEFLKLKKGELEVNLKFLNTIKKRKKVDQVLIGTKGIRGVKLREIGWITVRTYVTNKQLKEYDSGIYRIRPCKTLGSKFTIIVLFHNDETIHYLFNDREILNVKSLCLRFANFERRNKYNDGLNRWSILET